MDTENIIKSSQEQAVAAWINHLNQIRLDEFVESLRSINENQADQIARQSLNLSNALASIDKAISNVEKIISTNRGGLKGVHGYIGETAQVGVGNAHSQILGGEAIYEWVNDNGQWDLTKVISENGLKAPIQIKFVQKDLSLNALLEHLRKYPDSLEVGGKYLIPKDYYEKTTQYLNMPEDVAKKLTTSDGEYSFKEWKLVQEFKNSGKIPMDRIEPSDLTYKEVQAGKINSTLSKERSNIENINEQQNKRIEKQTDSQRKLAYENSKPSFAEGVKVTAVSAAFEGASTFCLEVIKKRLSGKKLAEFTEDDWKEICGKSTFGTLKGGVRGASIYALTNFTATPAAVASALTTAAFGIADQIHQYRNGNITEVQLIENSEILSLDAAVSALSSLIGQMAIPIPVLGPLIGNVVGTTIYQISKDLLSKKEAEILRAYLNEIDALRQTLDEEYCVFISSVNDELARFIALVQNAFAPDIKKAFDGSIDLALSLGLDDSEVLTSMEKIENYFLD